MLLKLKHSSLIAFSLALLINPIVSCDLLEAGSTEHASRQDEILSAAREMMESIPYCALITVDAQGNAFARLMEPLPPEDDLTVWLGTNPRSRKVEQIRANPWVTLFYSDPEGGGYVSLMGTAYLVNDPAEKARHWKEGWDMFYPDRENSFLLIEVVPRRIEVVSYPHRLVGDTLTWKAPALEFPEH